MHENDTTRIDFESNFNINKLSFNNVSNEFESKFKEAYKNSLEAMADDKDPLVSSSAANSLGILEKMAHQFSYYDRNSDFDKSYHDLLKEAEQYTET